MIENISSVINTGKLRELLSCQHINVISQNGGGNSRVFCVEAEGQKWAVKLYPPYTAGQRDRLSSEYDVYHFLHQHHIHSVPKLKTHCKNERWLIIEWIDGVLPNAYLDRDIEQAIAFIYSIKELNRITNANSLPLAAEACLSLDILLQQINKRFHNLKLISEQEPELKDFLTNLFHPTLEYYQEYAKAGYVTNQLHLAVELNQIKRSLIPADFGFHNSIRDRTGKLYFFDFDYFGWDDPVKLLADIIWHPKMNLSQQQQFQFVKGISDIYNNDKSFMLRYHYTQPLFGLRWALILLNEFLPVFWQNRQHAGTVINQTEAKKLQLHRAKELLLHIKEVGNPYEITATTGI